MRSEAAALCSFDQFKLVLLSILDVRFFTLSDNSHGHEFDGSDIDEILRLSYK